MRSVVVVLVLMLLSAVCFAAESIDPTFRVFQDNKQNFKKNIKVDEVNFPLDDKEVCRIVQQACEVTKCLSVVSEGSHWCDVQDGPGTCWAVPLEPLCGPFVAYLNEQERSVLCFCAYE
jgi:hypothetical protein